MTTATELEDAIKKIQNIKRTVAKDLDWIETQILATEGRLISYDREQLKKLQHIIDGLNMALDTLKK